MAHGLQVNTWTCDDPDRMRELIEWGIDGICTNVPDVALAVIGRPLGLDAVSAGGDGYTSLHRVGHVREPQLCRLAQVVAVDLDTGTVAAYVDRQPRQVGVHVEMSDSAARHHRAARRPASAGSPRPASCGT